MDSEEAPVISKNNNISSNSSQDESIYDGKTGQTFQDFFAFCSFVLAYEEQVKSTKLDNMIFSKGRGLGSAGDTDTSSDEESSNERRGGGGRRGGGRASGGTGNKRKRKEEEGDMTKESETESDTTNSSNDQVEVTSDEESWNLVTCYCGRPYAGRPMIECSKCLTWIHLYCAKIKKSNVPDFFLCQKCKTKQSRTQ
ncbi:PREDICTED: PHD finger protein 23A-like [Amphimedon queenslandica]|uniref:Zinc finger PHD-type domain-containing protein n=1 Tax=Amphimedon queenslandica TaxID=400682 RepID=A0A1X7VIP6_AMPQE|nr:PREDICTED: PHD finger protein 23A-like [Amphimedon queenslandica]|eukprot:XP_003384224.1 PREDICTED: PHD finger protein 23A-like [Amphimedon queenslandica]